MASTDSPNRAFTLTGRQPLNVVLRPGSPAEAAFRTAALEPGFEPAHELDLQYLGGKTLPQLAFRLVYLGRWSAADRRALDASLPAAMGDPGLNDVVAQYFPGQTVGSTFTGSTARRDAVSTRVDKPEVESLVRHLGPADGAVTCLLLPRGVVLVDGDVTSERGLAGYHGSLHVGGQTLYYAVAVYSEGTNGIVAFDEPWKNVCATLYHELQETRTDPDVEDAIRLGSAPGADRLLGWYSPRGGEIGDIPMSEAVGNLDLVMREVPLADGSGTVPIQLMWSNAVGGPEGPVKTPRQPQ
jgi:hypothetical protein